MQSDQFLAQFALAQIVRSWMRDGAQVSPGWPRLSTPQANPTRSLLVTGTGGKIK